MSQTLSNSFIVATNAAIALNSALGAFGALVLADGEKEKRYLYCRYGTYPQTVPGVGTIQQVVDREAADKMVANFRHAAGLEVLFKGIPIYEGHPDDPSWLLANPGHKPIAVGRIKSLEVGEDGIYAVSVFNQSGVTMLSGSAPPYDGHSARWRMEPIPGKAKHYRPVMLISDGLTNDPNIPGSHLALNTGNPSPDDPAADGGEPENTDNTHMKLTPEALKALGFAPDAEPSPADISAAIVRVCGEKCSAEAGEAEAETAATAANSRANGLANQLSVIRGKLSEVTAAAAVKDGRITEGDKPRWIDALNADYEGESAKLGKLMPVINTINQLPGNLGGRKEGTAIDPMEAMNAAVRKFATDNAIDISNADGFSRAWNGAKQAKPELFARA